MRTTVSSKGQIVLPSELRDQDGIHAGQQFAIERIEAGQYLLKRVAVLENRGLVDWLLECPEKGWFQPLSSESTDSILSGES
jgi:AbrB family looped-hinge helix DNA binding protein